VLVPADQFIKRGLVAVRNALDEEGVLIRTGV